jgi:dGTPase
VAQVGRRLAENLCNTNPRDVIKEVGGIDPDVVETAALAHDLGHPPFGHIAESELDAWLCENHISDGFEGNPQSFRVVTKFGIRLDTSPGLNLTRASLNAILKYPWPRASEAAGKKHRKWGHYQSEQDDFAFARANQPKGSDRKSAEAELMDWADDVAYSVHDVEDFYRAGLIPLGQILSETPERIRFIEWCFKTWENDPYKPAFSDLTKEWSARFFSRLGYFTRQFDLQQPFEGTATQLAGLDFLTAFLVKRFVVGPEGGKEIRAITLNPKRNEARIIIEPQIRAEVDLLKKLMSRYVYNNPALVAQQHGQRKIIGKLVGVLFEAAKTSSGMIPEPFASRLATEQPTDDTARARIVCDLIASMTEQQAINFYERISGLRPGSVRDLIIR